MKNKICNRKPEQAVEKDIKNRRNQNDSNRNTASKCLKFDSFTSIIDYDI